MSADRRRNRILSCLASAGFVAACSEPEATVAHYDTGAAIDADGFNAPTDATAAVNAGLASRIDLDIATDLELAQRGFVGTDEDLEIRSEDGRVIWRPADFTFLDQPAPASANPSLWRQARLNSIHGLFEVRPGIYQVRGYDLANMSIIEGETGRILVDPLTSVENARAALDLVNRELGERPITGIILTHSHIDHFGGLAAVIDIELIESGEVPVIAPAGFLEEAVSENVMAGVVMGRRAAYMYGTALPRSPRGHVGSGLGKHPSMGRYTIAEPNVWVTETGQELELDGVRMVFQYAPHTEAPAELTLFLPDFNAWCGAEIVSRTMHNLYTLRGAQVRDALAWSAAIDDALRLFGDETEVIFNSHHWPVWGNGEAREYLEAQRDIYKYIHDQTLRMAAQGMTPDEIADAIEFPASLENTFSVRGYYGTLRHNSRAVYQRYFGWYDGVPARLNPLPRSEVALRYVDAMGGMEQVLGQVESAFGAGEYRWSAELAQHAVFAEPGNTAARDWLARSYEQLGYRAESAPWRDVYLTGAWELRNPVEARDMDDAAADILKAIPLDMFFAAMATRLDAARAEGQTRRLNFVFSDVGESYVVEVSNGVMRHYRRDPVDDADATVTVTRAFWMRLIRQDAGLADMITSRDFAVEGDRAALLSFFSWLQQPDPEFAIVTP